MKIDILFGIRLSFSRPIKALARGRTCTRQVADRSEPSLPPPSRPVLDVPGESADSWSKVEVA